VGLWAAGGQQLVDFAGVGDGGVDGGFASEVAVAAADAGGVQSGPDGHGVFGCGVGRLELLGEQLGPGQGDGVEGAGTYPVFGTAVGGGGEQADRVAGMAGVVGGAGEEEQDLAEGGGEFGFVEVGDEGGDGVVAVLGEDLLGKVDGAQGVSGQAEKGGERASRAWSPARSTGLAVLRVP
jgi:hypothetical protein